MKTYYFSVTETLRKTVKVKAENEEQAYKKVKDACCDSKIILDAEDFVDREIKNETETVTAIIRNYHISDMPIYIID